MNMNNSNRRIAGRHTLLIPLMVIVLWGFGGSGSKAQLIGQNDTIILDRILAVVGGHPILQSDVESTYIQNQAVGVRLEGDEKCSILEDMMISKLLLDQAELDSIEKTDREVEAALQARLDYFINQAGSVEAIEEYFKKSMPEIKKDFFEDVKEQLLTEEMKKNLTADVKVTPSDVQKFYRKIPKEEMPLIPEQLEIRQIVVKPKISEEDRKIVIDRLNDFREQILGGRSMATLAAAYSEDPGSQPRGGELGFIRRADLVPEFTAVAFNLKPGEVSRVVKTDFGYHLIQLIDRQGESINARHILLKPKISAEAKIAARSRLDSIADIIRTGKAEFGEMALRYSVDEKSFANGGLMVNEYKGNTKFEPQELPAEMLAQVNRLKAGEISEPFESQDESTNPVMKIITVKSRVSAHQADIKTDYQYIQQLALREKQNEAINEWIEDKQKATFIRINHDYQGCEFQIPGWVK